MQGCHLQFSNGQIGNSLTNDFLAKQEWANHNARYFLIGLYRSARETGTSQSSTPRMGRREGGRESVNTSFLRPSHLSLRTSLLIKRQIRYDWGHVSGYMKRDKMAAPIKTNATTKNTKQAKRWYQLIKNKKGHEFWTDKQVSNTLRAPEQLAPNSFLFLFFFSFSFSFISLIISNTKATTQSVWEITEKSRKRLKNIFISYRFISTNLLILFRGLLCLKSGATERVSICNLTKFRL